MLGALAAGLPLAFVPGVTGALIPTGWPYLSILLPLFLFRRLDLNFGHLVGGFFLAWGIASLSWTTRHFPGVEMMWHWSVLACAFVIGSALPSLRPIWRGLGVGMSLNSVVALAQMLGWNAIPVYVYPAGLFFNSTLLSEAAALICVALLYAREWPLLAGSLPGLFIGGGRIAIAGFCVAALMRMPLRFALPLVGAGIAMLAAKGINIGSLQERFDIWAAVAADATFFGNGAASFFLDEPLSVHAHNDFAQVFYEFGLPGLLAFCAILGMALASSEGDAERAVVALYSGIACLSFPAFMPVSGFAVAIAAGFLCRAWPVLWRHRDLG